MPYYISTVEVLALDSLRITFEAPVVINSTSSAVGTYVLTCLDNSSIVPVKTVRFPLTSTGFSDTVLLEYPALSQGAEYTLALVNSSSVLAEDGTYIDSSKYARFTSDSTKIESIYSNLPDYYAKDIGSTLRGFLQAIANEDNTIGGFSDCTLLTGTGARSWISQVSASSINMYGVAWSPALGRFSAVGRGTSGLGFQASSNGTLWSAIGPASNQDFTALCWSPELAIYAACAQYTSTVAGLVQTSTNGLSWTSRTPSGAYDKRSICWSPSLNKFVIVGFNNIEVSANGTAWTHHSSPNSNIWRSVIWVPELAKYVAVSQDGSADRVMTSADGVTWTAGTGIPNNEWTSVAWSPTLGKLVAVSEFVYGANPGKRVMTSTDGVTWALQNTPADLNWQSVAWSPELSCFVAVALDGAPYQAMRSSDGVTWVLDETPVSSAWRSVAWSPTLQTFVAVGSNAIMTY